MKVLILMVFLFLSFRIETFCVDQQEVNTLSVCFMSGIHGDFSNNLSNLTYSFDNNFTLLILNGGINYNSNKIETWFAGLGLGSLFQVQYGQPFDKSENLIRVRIDYPLMWQFKEKDSFLNYTFVGLYYIHSDKNINFDENFGITFSVNVFRVLNKLSK